MDELSCLDTLFLSGGWSAWKPTWRRHTWFFQGSCCGAWGALGALAAETFPSDLHNEEMDSASATEFSERPAIDW